MEFTSFCLQGWVGWVSETELCYLGGHGVPCPWDREGQTLFVGRQDRVVLAVNLSYDTSSQSPKEADRVGRERSHPKSGEVQWSFWSTSGDRRQWRRPGLFRLVDQFGLSTHHYFLVLDFYSCDSIWLMYFPPIYFLANIFLKRKPLVLCVFFLTWTSRQEPSVSSTELRQRKILQHYVVKNVHYFQPVTISIGIEASLH